ncbi:kinase-like protein [Suillus bovinus]|uniref:kinase-like protein n=1 Tax=Suillus bovinus TaxID=48563 RepID=UPI001B8756F5|nr:kinase-like protein [Suillus bovinus]KAG2148648.1 kinase-like protein [Suillus bovinus]
MHVKRVTLTSKKNWWMVELDQEDEKPVHPSTKSFSSSEETAVVPDDGLFNREVEEEKTKEMPSPNPSIPVYNPPRHPNSIFSFPTPTAYSAPPNPTANLAPVAQGSASELFKCIVKKPDIVQLEINGEMQSNASDVTTQFLAELRVYTTVSRHRNIATFLGCLENVGMVLEYIDGRTLYEVIRLRPALTRRKKIDFHNQLLDGLTHLHSFRLSHGDLSLLNIQVTHSSDTIKLFDFGRSVSLDSVFIPPSDEPIDPFQYIARTGSTAAAAPQKKVEQIHPGTRPFAAPEVLRGECQDPILADAYSFGMILIAIDRVEVVDLKPWEQRKDVVPESLFEGCEVFEESARQYLRRCDSRKRLSKHDMMMLVDE